MTSRYINLILGVSVFILIRCKASGGIEQGRSRQG